MKNWLAANKGFLVFLLCLGVFRTAVADWNPIPSGSMRPTLLEGDVVFVNRLAYNVKLPFTDIVVAPLGDPQRGDIVTIDSAAAHELLVKRVVGVPGDTVALRENVLYVNGVRADYRPLARAPMPDAASGDVRYLRERFDGVSHIVRLSETAPSPLSSFGPVTVPAGEYLMLGDNRDDSADSRYFGFVPRKEVMGRARNVAFSLDPTRLYLPRLSRFGAALDQPLAAN